MRTRKEIQEWAIGEEVGGFAHIRHTTPSESIVIELLLEIRELLQKNSAQDYERNHSHFHCWVQGKSSACGIPLEKHTQCCLCDTNSPSLIPKIE